MALSRSFLKSAGLTDEQISAVTEEHTNVTNRMQKEIDKLKGGEDWQKKYEDEHNTFEDFKKKTAQDVEAAKVRAAYKKLLSDEQISEKWHDRIMKATDFSGMKLDKDGNLADLDKLKEALNKEWSDVKTTVTTQGAKVDNPPNSSNGKLTRSELDQKLATIKDASERQKLISENLNLYGKG